MVVYSHYPRKRKTVVGPGVTMINLRNRTEFSFGIAYGPLEKVLATNQGSSAGICDRHGTWGHIQWEKKCKKAGIKPIFGVELAVVNNMEEREKQPINYMSFLAKNNTGLKELYELVTLATEYFYYIPRIDYQVVNDISSNIIILSGPNPDLRQVSERDTFYFELSPSSNVNNSAQATWADLKCVALSDNYYCEPEDRAIYEMIAGRESNSLETPMHILSQWEHESIHNDPLSILVTHEIADQCNVEITKAKMVQPKIDKTLREMCEEGATWRKIDLTDPVYSQRLERELELIQQKNYEDYFFVVADMVQYAKEHMLVGPARGSSCGSLVCYLINITDIDPIPYDLLFERFIDINRMDYPDIDIDFPDTKREMVFDYVKEKYGHECVARFGTINRFKARSTITLAAKLLHIPAWEIEDFKDSIIKREDGDVRAKMCIKDTFDELEIGKKMLEKYPELRIAEQMEGHATHTGKHAAGILITANPVSNYCSIDQYNGVAQIDKYDAESIDLLKIDALGLRTLSVIEDALEQIGWTNQQLLDYPLNDKTAYQVINDKKFSGVFQFEGVVLQGLCKQVQINNIEDIIALTALCRPGPMNSGSTDVWIKRKTGKRTIEYLHDLTEEVTNMTFGVIVYQEQVMQISRLVGQLSWEDVSALRKAMGKSLGKEKIDAFWTKFKEGAKDHGLSEENAQEIWDGINSMGSYAFNRSHAVAYGIVSYWCMLLKAKFPLEYSAACLRNAKDKDQVIKILRELHNEGYGYKPYDKELSVANWSVQNGELIGGLLNIKGIADKTCNEILRRREEGEKLTPRQTSLLNDGVTPFDVIFEGSTFWQHVIDDPTKYGIASRLYTLEEVEKTRGGAVVFLAKLTKKSLRDHNEPLKVEQRNGKLYTGQTNYLTITMEDDQEQAVCFIDRKKYLKIGQPIVEDAAIGDWFVIKAMKKPDFDILTVLRVKRMTDNPDFALSD